MRHGVSFAVAGATLALYVGVILVGARLGPRALDYGWHAGPKVEPWRMARLSGVSAERAAEIEWGRRLFDETPLYSSAGVKSRISCSNCHLEGGIAPYGLAVVGSAQSFPQYSKRAGRQITLEDRVEECMTRSENGDCAAGGWAGDEGDCGLYRLAVGAASAAGGVCGAGVGGVAEADGGSGAWRGCLCGAVCGLPWKDRRGEAADVSAALGDGGVQ